MWMALCDLLVFCFPFWMLWRSEQNKNFIFIQSHCFTFAQSSKDVVHINMVTKQEMYIYFSRIYFNFISSASSFYSITKNMKDDSKISAIHYFVCGGLMGVWECQVSHTVNTAQKKGLTDRVLRMYTWVMEEGSPCRWEPLYKVTTLPDGSPSPVTGSWEYRVGPLAAIWSHSEGLAIPVPERPTGLSCTTAQCLPRPVPLPSLSPSCWPWESPQYICCTKYPPLSLFPRKPDPRRSTTNPQPCLGLWEHHQQPTVLET